MQNTRHCNGCNTTKSLTEFTKDKADPTGYTYRCKECRKKASSVWAKANPDKVKQANLDNREKRKKFYSSEEGRRSSRKSWLKKTYNLSIEEYEKLLVAQDGKCAICNEPESKERWRCLAVDHCHTTGNIRQLLCWKCNSGLGLFNDNKQLLTNAIKYLETHESTTVSRLLQNRAS